MIHQPLPNEFKDDCQYIGIQDVQQQKLYFGDMVEHLQREKRYLIVWSQDSCSFVLVNGQEKIAFTRGIGLHLKKIGNFRTKRLR